MIKAVKNKRARHNHGNRLPIGPNGGVQLLLIQTVKDLGKVGDIVEVKKGYATNYLIPQGMATVATEHHRRMVEKRKAELEEIRRQKIETAKELAAKIATKTVTFMGQMNAEHKLYGSVSKEDVANLLKAENIEIAPAMVCFEGAIKDAGQYEINIQLADGVDAKLKLWVLPKEDKKA